ncbi:MAG: GNAT family N-acetyltransferase [bacterium]|nr:GNAT family N-acetyltransferase [bacterium]
MAQKKDVTIIDVNAGNVEKTGFFCFMSKRKSEGFRQKMEWVKARFNEGMRIKMLELPLRGFIEYIPGEYAWRAINARDYMVIQCLWVLGKSKKQGLGSLLLEECIADAKQAGKKGVVMVTSEKVWLMKKKLLVKHGFESMDQAPPAFNLMVKKFGDAQSPSFTGNWEEKAARYGDGITVFTTPQCPYLPDAAKTTLDFAKERGIPYKEIQIKDAEEVRQLVPSAFGIFSIVHNGKLLAYHYLLPKDLVKKIPN